MKNDKVLLVSINSIGEYTGGGIYLRTIFNGYMKNNNDVCLICKEDSKVLDENNNHKQIMFNKSIVSDLLSRFFLCPSFLFFYIFKIIRISKDYDCIAFHSSRLGLISKVLKTIYPKKKIIFHFDNVESHLISQAPISLNPKGVITFIDRFLVPISEKLAIKSSNCITFITEEDKSFFQNQIKSKEVNILPVCVPSPNEKNQSDIFNLRKNNRIKLLFTGTFSFFPNVEALAFLLQLAKNSSKYDFIIAGKNLNKVIIHENLPNNVYTYSNVTVDELSSLYMYSNIFISPIQSGSGMKTKLAEAMSYGLPIIAHQNSVSGYLDAIKLNIIQTFNDNELGEESLNKYIENALKLTHSDIVNVYSDFYSIECGTKVIASL